VKKSTLRDVGRMGNKHQAGGTSGASVTDVKGRRRFSGQALKLILYLQKCHQSFLTSVFSLEEIN